MISKEESFAILDSVNHPIIFVDNEHIVRYVNAVAEKRYEASGAAKLVGQSVFNCHNPESRQHIIDIHKRFLNGDDEVFLKVNDNNERVTVVAVRDRDRNLLGYYERYERGK